MHPTAATSAAARTVAIPVSSRLSRQELVGLAEAGGLELLQTPLAHCGRHGVAHLVRATYQTQLDDFLILVEVVEYPWPLHAACQEDSIEDCRFRDQAVSQSTEESGAVDIRTGRSIWNSCADLRVPYGDRLVHGRCDVDS
jgi:hypothetical protein